MSSRGASAGHHAGDQGEDDGRHDGLLRRGGAAAKDAQGLGGLDVERASPDPAAVTSARWLRSVIVDAGLYKRWRGWASTGSGTHKETLLGRLGVHAWPLQYRPAGAFSLLLKGCCGSVESATAAPFLAGRLRSASRITCAQVIHPLYSRGNVTVRRGKATASLMARACLGKLALPSLQ